MLHDATRKVERPDWACAGGDLQGWLRDPVTLRVGPQGRVPAGLQHRYIVVEEGRKLIVACRQLRLDLQRCGSSISCPSATSLLYMYMSNLILHVACCLRHQGLSVSCTGCGAPCQWSGQPKTHCANLFQEGMVMSWTNVRACMAHRWAAL